MIYKKIINLFKQNWLKVFSVTFLLLFFGSYANIFALPPDSPYQAGETLDPTCLPGDVNCTVSIVGGVSVDTDLLSVYTDSLGAPSQLHSVFLGYQAGYNTDFSGGGGDVGSNFLGYQAGYDASYSTDANFLGTYAGMDATNASKSNFIGYSAGNNASSANDSNFIGTEAGVDAYNANFSNFIGYNAGNHANLAPYSNFIGFSSGINAYEADNSNFFGTNAGYEATFADHSNFLGPNAGAYATNALNSNFLGWNAGNSATDATNSNFIGRSAGNSANSASNSNFFGWEAGMNAPSASSSNFIGSQAGYNATSAGNSNFFGRNAGNGAISASNSNFFGQNAGYSADTASNSIFLGQSAGYNDTVNNTGNVDDFSILIGKSTSTGGFSNSIAIGGSATNTASNQLMVGSTTRPINTTRFQGATTECTITTGTGIACTSDETLKNVTSDLDTNILDKLTKIRTVNFEWLDDNSGKNNIGFLAQDLEQYFPELVSTDYKGYKSVYYANMTPILVEAIREMDLKVDGLISLDTEIKSSLGSLIKNFLSDIGNGLEVVFFGEVRAKRLCLDDLCIEKSDLENILNKQDVYHGAAPSKINDVVEEEDNIDDTEISNSIDNNEENKETDEPVDVSKEDSQEEVKIDEENILNQNIDEEEISDDGEGKTEEVGIDNQTQEGTGINN